MTKNLTLKLILLLAISVTLAMPGFAANDEHSNRRAPGWSLPDVNFNFHDLMDFRGKVVLLEFMQTSCPHCQQSTKNLKTLAAKYGEKVVLIHVVNPPSNLNEVKQYVSNNKLTSPVVFDSGQVAASYLRITPKNPGFDVPHIFVIDKTGKIVNDYGYTTANEKYFFGNGLGPILDTLTK